MVWNSRSIGLLPRLPSAALAAMLNAACTPLSNEIEPAPPHHHEAVIFDIDGTLTPRVMAMGTARDGAAAAVNEYARGGCRIVYLSARHPLFQGGVDGWLRANGFPEGSIHLTQSRADRSDHMAFKLRVLEDYLSEGWTFIAAYGDSSTDFEAYARAGLDKSRVFALKREGDQRCQPGAWEGCYASWAEQMDTISRLIHTNQGSVADE